jgi:hypothetical protein
MAPVKTAVILPTGTQIDLIIPLSSGTSFKALQDLAIERAGRHHSTNVSGVTDILLRLGSRSGPFLFPDDKVEDVASPGETVFVMLTELSPVAFASKEVQAGPSVITSQPPDAFQVRVITPHSAHCHEDIRTIPLLEKGKFFSAQSTLSDLRASIAASLDVLLGPDPPLPQECNCKLADMSSSARHPPMEGKLKVLVVSGFSEVAWMDVLTPTYGSIMAGLRQRLGETFEDNKTVHLKGGNQTEEDVFTNLPVVSVCAKSRHSDMHHQTSTTPPFGVTSALDLHTAEGPIQTSCMDFSAQRLGLTELVVNGVLSVYAVERKADPVSPERQVLGKDAMFSTASHWVSLSNSVAYLQSPS